MADQEIISDVDERAAIAKTLLRTGQVPVIRGEEDGPAADATLRSLGSGATQAAAGNDSRFTTPTGAVITPAASKIPLSDSSGKIKMSWVKGLWFSVADYGATGDGDTNDSTAIAAALSDATGKTLYFPAGTYKIGSNLTIPAGTRMLMESGAKIKQGGSVTLAVNGPFEAPLSQCFQGFSSGQVQLGANAASEIYAEWWGAVGDGVTDDHAAIQQAIDCAMYWAKCPVRLLAKVYLIEDTIQLGYGCLPYQLKGGTLLGSGNPHRGESQASGTTIKALIGDRPAINVQGGRYGAVRDLALLGANFDWVVTTKQLGLYPDCDASIDDTLPASWVDPDLTTTYPNCDSRYAPYAGICVDGYAGAAPTPAYPNVTYPAWTTPGGQYNKSPTTGLVIENVGFYGFVVGCVVQPSGYDGNGDYIKFRDCLWEANKYCISVGNSQSRNIGVEDSYFLFNYCFMTNRIHGAQKGELDSSLRNLSGGFGIILFDVNTQASRSFHIDSMYVESLWRIGYLGSATGDSAPVAFTACNLGFELQNESQRGVPPNLLDLGTGRGHVSFRACHLRFSQSVHSFVGGTVEFDGVKTDTWGNWEPTAIPIYKALAYNATCGGLVTSPLSHPRVPQKIMFKLRNLDTGVTVTTVNFHSIYYRSTKRIYGIPFYAIDVTPEEDYGSFSAVKNGNTNATYFIDKASLVSATLVNKTLTLQLSAYTEWSAELWGPHNGDVLYDEATGSVFFVTARTTTSVANDTLIAELQNNYKPDGEGGFEVITALNLSSGYLSVINSRIYTPRFFIQGDVSAGSAVLSNCGRSDGYAAWYDAEISVGDRVFVDSVIDNFFPETLTEITARDQSAGTITLAGVATATQSKKRLGLFVRAPPANYP